MRDGALPAVLLSLAFGMAICRQRGRDLALTMIVFVAAAVVASALIFPDAAAAPTALLLAILTAVFVAAVYVDRPLSRLLVIGLALAAGVAIGVLTSFSGQSRYLVAAIASTLIIFPSRWFVGRNRSIVVKVAASWILAVALLSIGLNLAQGVSQGSDHLD